MPKALTKGLRIVQHCAVFGELITPIRKWEVYERRPYAQYDVGVSIHFVPPRKRNWRYYTFVPDNIRWATVEDDDGKVVWDSRTVVLCDMVVWQVSRDRHGAESNRRDEEIAAIAARTGLKLDISRPTVSSPTGNTAC